MITLNTEKGWVRLESWDDVLSRPGFLTDVDPNAVTLKSIIGNYAFPTFLPCGLSSCHTPHGRGYLVVTSDGHETNIGKDCGKKYFSVDFERMVRVFDRDIRAQERREALTAIQNQIPALKARIHALKHEAAGANWIHQKLNRFSPAGAGLPSEILRLVSGLVKQRDGKLTKSRLASAEELELMRAQGQRVQLGQTIVEEPAGVLDGLPALYKENDLRDLLVDQMKPLETIESADVATLKEGELRELAKWAVTVEPTLARAETAISAGRRLLTQANLQQLSQFVSTKNERAALASFLQELPAS